MSGGGHLQDSSPNPLPPEATGAPPSQKSILFKVLSAGFSGALLVLILVWFRDEIAEYGPQVDDALRGLNALQVLGLLVAAFLLMTFSAMAMRTPLTGISTVKAFVAQQSSTAISNVIPGPSGTAARFAILHSWKVSVEDFTRGTVAVSIWSNVCMISMPGIAFVILAVTGATGKGSVGLIIGAVVAVIVSVIALVVVTWALRSEWFSRRLGTATMWLINPLRRLVRKPPFTGLDHQAALLRERTATVLAAKKARLTAITVGAYWLNGLLMTACIWAAGVPHAELPFVVGLALYSVGRIGTIIQITPGGVGVVEVVYSAVYMSALPDQYDANVVTGVLLYRLLTYILPIAVGSVCYFVWRLMRRAELKREATPATAT